MGSGAAFLVTDQALNCYFVEPMTGIEPAYSAWEAISTPERVSDNAWSQAVPVTANSG
jgi:hypothetical protein